MARRVIHHEPTEDQWDVIDSIFDPYVSARGSEKDQTIMVYEIVDDYQVTLYIIRPDGTYHTESMEDGFHYGWTARDMDGEEL